MTTSAFIVIIALALLYSLRGQSSAQQSSPEKKPPSIEIDGDRKPIAQGDPEVSRDLRAQRIPETKPPVVDKSPPALVTPEKKPPILPKDSNKIQDSKKVGKTEKEVVSKAADKSKAKAKGSDKIKSEKKMDERKATQSEPEERPPVAGK